MNKCIFLLCSLLLFPALSLAQPWSENTKAIGKASNLPSGVLSKAKLDELVGIGEELFTAKFTSLDGAGRPGATQAIIPTKPRHQTGHRFSRTSGLDSNACSSCHNDPVPGGAGDFVTTVFLSEGFVNADFDSTDSQFSNERGTNHLFGSGLIELLAREMTVQLQGHRVTALKRAADSEKSTRIALITKGVSFGFLTAHPDGIVDLDEIEGVDVDLVIRPFSQKGVMTSLRQFTINALNHHHGMQAVERFGARWTGSTDFDDDGIERELSAGDISALVAWQATRQPPGQMLPKQKIWVEAAQTGRKLFQKNKCTQCHLEELPLNSLKFSDPGHRDVSGTLNRSQVAEPAIYDLSLLDWSQKLSRNEKGEYMIPLFGDLKRHKITDPSHELLGNELLSQRFVDRTIFQTSELWGIGSTAPYGHRNDFTTLDEIIRAHGGEAKSSRELYEASSAEDRSSIIAFLKTLVINP